MTTPPPADLAQLLDRYAAHISQVDNLLMSYVQVLENLQLRLDVLETALKRGQRVEHGDNDGGRRPDGQDAATLPGEASDVVIELLDEVGHDSPPSLVGGDADPADDSSVGGDAVASVSESFPFLADTDATATTDTSPRWEPGSPTPARRSFGAGEAAGRPDDSMARAVGAAGPVWDVLPPRPNSRDLEQFERLDHLKNV